MAPLRTSSRGGSKRAWRHWLVHRAELVVTRLPLASVERLSALRYHATKAVFFPRTRRTMARNAAKGPRAGPVIGGDGSPVLGPADRPAVGMVRLRPAPHPPQPPRPRLANDLLGLAVVWGRNAESPALAGGRRSLASRRPCRTPSFRPATSCERNRRSNWATSRSGSTDSSRKRVDPHITQISPIEKSLQLILFPSGSSVKPVDHPHFPDAQPSKPRNQDSEAKTSTKTIGRSTASIGTGSSIAYQWPLRWMIICSRSNCGFPACRRRARGCTRRARSICRGRPA